MIPENEMIGSLFIEPEEAWKQFPLKPGGYVRAVDYEALSLALAERAAVVGLHPSPFEIKGQINPETGEYRENDFTVVSTNTINAFWAQLMPVAARYFNPNTRENFTLATLRQYAGIGDGDGNISVIPKREDLFYQRLTNWHLEDVKINDPKDDEGRGGFGEPQYDFTLPSTVEINGITQNTPIFVEHINEIWQCIKALKRIRFRTEFRSHFTSGTNATDVDFSKAYNQAHAGAFNNFANSFVAQATAGYSASATFLTEPNRYQVGVVCSMFRHDILFFHTPIWSALKQTALQFANSEIGIDLSFSLFGQIIPNFFDTLQRQPIAVVGAAKPSRDPINLSDGGVFASFAPAITGFNYANYGGPLPNAENEEVSLFFRVNDYVSPSPPFPPSIGQNNTGGLSGYISQQGVTPKQGVAFADVMNFIFK